MNEFKITLFDCRVVFENITLKQEKIIIDICNKSCCNSYYDSITKRMVVDGSTHDLYTFLYELSKTNTITLE